MRLRLLDDENAQKWIRKGLPEAFRIVEIENSRAGKVSMEVGNHREKVIIGLLIAFYGKDKVQTSNTYYRAMNRRSYLFSGRCPLLLKSTNRGDDG